MKKLISIIVLTLTAILVVVLNVLPHHHHGGTDCLVMEICEQDGHINDEHTTHHFANDCTSSEDADESDCTLQTLRNYVVNPVANPLAADELLLHFIPLLAILVGELPQQESLTTTYGHSDLNNYYQSALVCRFHGLRAPPVI